MSTSASRFGRDDPPMIGTNPTPAPRRADPRQSLFPSGESIAARRQNTEPAAQSREALDANPEHEILCHGLAGWLKDKVPPEVHAQIAPKLHALPALAAAGKIPPEIGQGESDRLREPGELMHEDRHGLSEPAGVAMDAVLKALPRHLTGFRQCDFGPRRQ